MKKLLVLTFQCFVFFAQGTSGASESRDERENKMAEDAVFWALADKDAGISDSQAELGLIVLGINSTLSDSKST